MPPLVQYSCNCGSSGSFHTHLINLEIARRRGVLLSSSFTPQQSTSGRFALDLRDAIRGSILAMLIGDALGSPLHWIYSSEKLAEIKRDLFMGGIEGYHHGSTIGKHPDSWKYFSRCDPKTQPVDSLFGGRGSELNESWSRQGTPYHNTLEAGDNTLTARLIASLVDHIVTNKGLDIENYLVSSYIPVITREDQRNNDTWVDETHRVFIRNLVAGAHPFEAGMDDLCLTGIALCIPLLLAYSGNRDDCEISVRTLLQLTHKHEDGVKQALAWGDLLKQILAPHTSTLQHGNSRIPALSVDDALKCSFEAFSEGRMNLDEVLSRGLSDLDAYHGQNVVFSSR